MIKVPHRTDIERAADPLQMEDARAAGHPFLREPYRDGHYPDQVVDRNRDTLLWLCALTHAATEECNDLEAAFEEAGSEVDTVAREAMAEDVAFAAGIYGFPDADVEVLIAPREW
ncbi:DUF5713 family protein [Streptomyces sp. NPDC003393]